MAVSTVEIKTKVAASSLQSYLHLTRVDPVICDFGDETFRKFVEQLF